MLGRPRTPAEQARSRNGQRKTGRGVRPADRILENIYCTVKEAVPLWLPVPTMEPVTVTVYEPVVVPPPPPPPPL